LGALTKREILIFIKSPFKRERYALIHEIYQKGVSCYLLAEISGLGKSTIHRIGTRTGDVQLGGVARGCACDPPFLLKNGLGNALLRGVSIGGFLRQSCLWPRRSTVREDRGNSQKHCKFYFLKGAD
jgi:hypothetical protein